MRHKGPYRYNPVEVVTWIIIIVAIIVTFLDPPTTGAMFK